MMIQFQQKNDSPRTAAERTSYNFGVFLYGDAALPPVDTRITSFVGIFDNLTATAAPAMGANRSESSSGGLMT